MGGNGGTSGNGLVLGIDASVVVNTGTIGLVSASGAAGTAGSGGDGGTRGSYRCGFLGLDTCYANNGNVGSAGGTGSSAVAFSASGAGYIGAASGGSSSADITFSNNSMTLGSLAIQSSGALTIKPTSDATIIGLANGSGALQLPQSAFWNGTVGNIKDGFSSITIGSATQSGAINVNGLTVSDALTLQTSGAVTVNGALTTNNQNLTITGGSYTQNNFDIVAGSGDISITADSVAFNTNTDSNPMQTSGTLTLRPKTTTTAMTLASANAYNAGTGLDLNATEVGYLNNIGASTVTIGRTDSTGTMTIAAAVNLAGKTINLNAGSFTDGNTTNRIITADTLNLAARSSGGAIGGSTNNNAIDFVANTVSANTTGNGSAYLTTASPSDLILGNSSVGGSLVLSASSNLTLHTVTAGNDLSLTTSGSLTFDTLTSGNNLSLSTGDDLMLGATTAGGTLALTTSGTGGSVTQSGVVTAGTLMATLAGTNSQLNLATQANTIGNLAGITAGGGFSLTNGNTATTVSANITTSAGNGAVSINTGTGTYTQNANIDIVSGSGDITVTADNMVINTNTGNNAFNTTGTLALETTTASRGIKLGDNTEIGGQLTLQDSELTAFSSATPSTTIIGRVDGTGAMTIGYGTIGGSVLNLKAGNFVGDFANSLSVNSGAGTLNLIANNSGGDIGSSATPIAFAAGTVTANTTGNGSAYLNRTLSGVVLGVSNVGSGVFSITALGSITQSGALSAGTLKLKSTASDVTLDNAGNSIAALSSGSAAMRNLTLVNTQGLEVGPLSITGNLNLDIGGNIITAGALAISGTTTINAHANDVTLNNATNSFTGAISVAARDLTIRNHAVSTVLGASTLSGNLGLTSTFGVTQTAPLTVSGVTTLVSNNAMALTNTSNSFGGAVSVTGGGGDVTITSSGDLHLGTSKLGSGAFNAIAGAGGGTPGLGDLYLDNGTTITSNSPWSYAVVLVAGDGTSKFINNAGADAIKLTGGGISRWLVYSNDPYNNGDVLGGLKSGNEAVWHTYYPSHAAASGQTENGASAIAEAGNRYVFRVGPEDNPGYNADNVKITVTNVSKTYGDALTLSTANNTAIVYAQGDMSFEEFSQPKPDWLDVSALTLASTGAAATAHVGSYDIAASGNISGQAISLSPTGTWSYTGGGHTIDFFGSANILITPRILTASVDGGTVANKVYDGTITASFSDAPTFSLGNIANGDSIGIDTGNVTGQFEDKNVGTGKLVTLDGLLLANNEHGDYVLPDTLPTYTGDITARSLTVAATGVNKTYDATDVATATLAASSTVAAGTAGSGLISGDSVSYAYTGAVFDAGKDAGTNKAISVSGITLDGSDAGNYFLFVDTATTTANIAKRSLSLSSLIGSKVYDGSADLAAATFAVDTSNVFGSDVVTGATGDATFNTRHVGVGKTLTADLTSLALIGTDAGNYDLGTGTYSGSGDITAKAVTLTAGGVSKSYNADTAYTAQASDLITLSGQLGVAGDAVSAATITYADANAGAGNKTVTLDAITLNDGNGGNNYAVTLVGNSNSTIDKAAVTVSTSDVIKTYDGTTAATGSGSVVSGQLFGSDAIDASNLTFAFDNARAGIGNKLVIVSGSPVISDGNSGANYIVTVANNTTSTINPALLTATITNTGVTKVYDGNTNASDGFTPTWNISGLVENDTAAALTSSGTAYNSKNVSEADKIIVSGLTISSITGSNGSLTSDYALDAASKELAASITPRTVTVTADAKSKNEVDADPAFTYQAEVQQGDRGLVSGESLSGNLSRASGETEGGYEITQGTVNNTTNPNYDINYVGAQLTIVAITDPGNPSEPTDPAPTAPTTPPATVVSNVINQPGAVSSANSVTGNGNQPLTTVDIGMAQGGITIDTGSTGNTGFSSGGITIGGADGTSGSSVSSPGATVGDTVVAGNLAGTSGSGIISNTTESTTGNGTTGSGATGTGSTGSGTTIGATSGSVAAGVSITQSDIQAVQISGLDTQVSIAAETGGGVTVGASRSSGSQNVAESSASLTTLTIVSVGKDGTNAPEGNFVASGNNSTLTVKPTETTSTSVPGDINAGDNAISTSFNVETKDGQTVTFVVTFSNGAMNIRPQETTEEGVGDVDRVLVTSLGLYSLANNASVNIGQVKVAYLHI